MALVVKNSPANEGDARDMGSIPELGRSPEEGNGNPLQYYWMKNPMDRGTWCATVCGVTKSRHNYTRTLLAHRRNQRLYRFVELYRSLTCETRHCFRCCCPTSSITRLLWYSEVHTAWIEESLRRVTNLTKGISLKSIRLWGRIGILWLRIWTSILNSLQNLLGPFTL